MKKRMKKIIALGITISFIILTSCSVMKETKEFNLIDLQKISVLNTLTCSFKNVVTYEVPQSVPILNIPLPSEKYFLEYTANIKIGINMREIEYDEKTKTIKIPKAQVLETPTYDLSSMKERRYQKYLASGLDINISQNKLSESLAELKEKVEANSSIMNKAQSLALNQIESLVNNVYTVAGRKPNFNYALK